LRRAAVFYFIFICGSSQSVHELYDSIVENLEAIQKWNEDIRAFMAKEQVEPSFVVTF
jgi:hypothetical protein